MGKATGRGRPERDATRIQAYADAMTATGQRVNKSRIARELHVSLRYVFMVLPRISV